ncbi:GNAT family N-acetyltransferase [Butyrivibrio sp. INlla16]|uniref:GNAT family N-acetyltransferase n=1 Tax=Butyrivibrio sp. INlla16 TaxID=1520807 RepID=UPI00088C301C|nr:GNAT family protein [Butyrivibrio sp. INlla16]SDB37264.1 Protein N-acetyltransferase, RimJ/RimL family [Butyrivibrio sp. INlla16]
MKVIEGDKVYLREITYDDTPMVVKWRNNPRVRNNFIYREVFTDEIHNNWMKTKVETGEVVQLIICPKDDAADGEGTGDNAERPVGSVYLRDIDMTEKTAEYGIFIGEDDAIGHGYGNEAAELMCRYAASKLGLKRLILRVFADNISALKSYEHAGFVKTEDLPKVLCSDGETGDMILMEKIL